MGIGKGQYETKMELWMGNDTIGKMEEEKDMSHNPKQPVSRETYKHT